jgi:hypothetical protein
MAPFQEPTQARSSNKKRKHMETQKLWRQASLTALAVGLGAGTFATGMAQTAGYGTISGTVQDTGHASVAGAKVRILDKDTGAERDTTTSGAGTYLVDFLTPGRYEVIVSSPGFSTIDRKNLTLQVGQVLGIDIALRCLRAKFLPASRSTQTARCWRRRRPTPRRTSTSISSRTCL